MADVVNTGVGTELMHAGGVVVAVDTETTGVVSWQRLLVLLDITPIDDGRGFLLLPWLIPHGCKRRRRQTRQGTEGKL